MLEVLKFFVARVTVRAVITVGTVGTSIYLVVARYDVPEWWVAIVSGVVGYYIGGEAEQTVKRVLKLS